MQRSILTAAVVIAILLIQSTAPAHGDPSDPEPAGETGPKLETLLEMVLEGVDSTEVIVSRVTLPPNTTLPKHWHPGEEFAYVLSGSVTLWQRGKEDIIGEAGDVVTVPLKQVHTAITKDEGATILVFRVHQQGQPERVPLEEN